MKVFVTGLTGYLARGIASHLRAQGHRIAGSSRRAAAMPGVDVVHAALGDPIDHEALKGCDAIIHTAHDFEPGSMDRNIEGTLAFRNAAAKAGVRQQIFLTSCSARPDAESEYGRTKYSIEQYFTDSCSVAARLGLVIGNGGLFARQRGFLLRTPVVPLIGAGDSPVALVAISHVLAATDVILRECRTGRQNLFYDGRPTMKEFVREVKTHAGQRPVLFRVGARFALSAVTAARWAGLRIPVDPGQISALARNQDWPWQSDLPDLLPEHQSEFCLRYALDQLSTGA
jgi:NADH dehydrogenase